MSQSPPPRLRLVRPLPVAPRRSWSARASEDGRAFLLRHGHALADPSLAALVIEECAELAWDAAPHEGWNGLKVTELWFRLATMHRFFPQPRLVVAYYETLRSFLPWLLAQNRLEREQAMRMMRELEVDGAPMLEQARAQLAARRR